MSSTAGSGRDDEGMQQHSDSIPPTYASFSPVTLAYSTAAAKHRSTILVHQKSPLLLATPPQITRALAYSHPFILPLNQFAGLLTWTSGDPWQSFLLVACFWAVVLYGDIVLRWAGPVVVVVGLILGMYARRYSPLSSTGVTGEKQKGHKREDSEATTMRHQKTLDEIVDTLKAFTSRCNLLLDPFLQLTDFLSTQRTATSATTRPALTVLFVRILLVTPLWIILTLPPIRIVTTKRIVLVIGTLILTWHSKPTRVSRAILWRSAFVRRVCAVVTGLHFDIPGSAPNVASSDQNGKSNLPPREQKHEASLAAADAKRRPSSAGVRFTFILYENQRRWVGIGWTTSLLAYERAPWTDEHMNPAPPKDDFQLPEVEGGLSRWRWVDGTQWLVEGAGEFDEGGPNAKAGTADGGQGWIYYDNKWQTGRRGQDGWGKYTRRRKWFRDAELVEVTPSTEITPSPTPTPDDMSMAEKPRSRANTDISVTPSEDIPPKYEDAVADDASSTKSSGLRPGALKRKGKMSTSSGLGSEDETLHPHARQPTQPSDWGIGDEARMGLE